MAEDHRSAEEYLPKRISLTSMREAVQGCRGCDLYKHASQAVFGEGLKRSRVMLVGEQPGDQEDRQGRPFVGPAGGELDRALEAAGIDRDEVYVTNAVKHFKWVPVGKRRQHRSPGRNELIACRPWLEAEISVVQPELLVALGASAAKSLFGREFRVTKQRGKLFESQWAPRSMGTVHPSSILRAPTNAQREESRAAFVRDMSIVASALHKSE